MFCGIAFNRPGSDLLSRVLRRSTIGAGAFHGRVRNGNGCGRPAMTTRSTKGNVMRSWQALPVFFLNTSSLPGLRGTSHTGQRPSPIVWRAVRSVATKPRQREDRRDGSSTVSMSIVNENDQVDRAISKAKLHALLHVHTPPINVVVFHGPDREYSFSGGFPA